MTADPDQPWTWEPILVRCPRCTKGIVPDAAEQHMSAHYLYAVGDYLTKDLHVVETHAESAGIYAGSGKAKFYDEPSMRWVGLMKPKEDR